MHMNTSNLKRELIKQIMRLNRAIDERIVVGLTYKDLAIEHKYLVSVLNNIK